MFLGGGGVSRGVCVQVEGCVCPEGVCVCVCPEGVCVCVSGRLSRGCTPPQIQRHTPGPRGRHPPWTEGMTHACENITFPQLLLRAVIMK